MVARDHQSVARCLQATKTCELCKLNLTADIGGHLALPLLHVIKLAVSCSANSSRVSFGCRLGGSVSWCCTLQLQYRYCAAAVFVLLRLLLLIGLSFVTVAVTWLGIAGLKRLQLISNAAPQLLYFPKVVGNLELSPPDWVRRVTFFLHWSVDSQSRLAMRQVL